MNIKFDSTQIGIKPIKIWLGLFIIVTGLFIWMMRSQILIALKSDQSGMTLLICGAFVIGLIGSFMQSLRLSKDWSFFTKDLKTWLNEKEDEDRPFLSTRHSIARILDRVRVLQEQDLNVDVSGLSQSYYIRQNSLNRNVATFSTLLVTLGLIGTIVGLIYAVSGLDNVIHNVGASRDDLLVGMRQTIQGMGTAFYTTFLGALSGGVILKMLSASMNGCLTKMAASFRDFMELEYLPYLKSRPLVLKKEKVKFRLSEGVSGLADAHEEMMEDLRKQFQSLAEQVQNYQTILIHSDDKVNKLQEIHDYIEKNQLMDQFEALLKEMKNKNFKSSK